MAEPSNEVLLERLDSIKSTVEDLKTNAVTKEQMKHEMGILARDVVATAKESLPIAVAAKEIAVRLDEQINKDDGVKDKAKLALEIAKKLKENQDKVIGGIVLAFLASLYSIVFK